MNISNAPNLRCKVLGAYITHFTVQLHISYHFCHNHNGTDLFLHLSVSVYNIYIYIYVRRQTCTHIILPVTVQSVRQQCFALGPATRFVQMKHQLHPWTIKSSRQFHLYHAKPACLFPHFYLTNMLIQLCLFSRPFQPHSAIPDDLVYFILFAFCVLLGLTAEMWS